MVAYFGPVAQLIRAFGLPREARVATWNRSSAAERPVYIRNVGGSNPPGSTKLVYLLLTPDTFR